MYHPLTGELVTEMKFFNPPSLLRYAEMEIAHRPLTTYLIELNFDDVFVMEIDIAAMISFVSL